MEIRLGLLALPSDTLLERAAPLGRCIDVDPADDLLISPFIINGLLDLDILPVALLPYFTDPTSLLFPCCFG